MDQNRLGQIVCVRIARNVISLVLMAFCLVACDPYTEPNKQMSTAWRWHRRASSGDNGKTKLVTENVTTATTFSVCAPGITPKTGERESLPWVLF